MRLLTKNYLSLEALEVKFSKTLLAIIFMLLWGCSHTATMSFAKLISSDVNNFIIVFLRCFFGFIFFMPFAMKMLVEKGIQGLKTNHPFLQTLRILIVGIAMTCTYYTYRHLPIATASAIGFSSPLFTTLLASLFLNTRVGYSKWILLLVGYLGVLIIIRPFSYFSVVIYIAILANFLASCSLIIIKKISFKDSTVTIMFYTNLMTLMVFSIIALWSWETPEIKDLILIACLALSSTLSQFFYIQALRLGDPAFLSAFEYVRLLFAIISGYLFFGEIPDSSTLVGAFIIIFAIFYLSHIEMNRTVKPAI